MSLSALLLKDDPLTPLKKTEFFNGDSMQRFLVYDDGRQFASVRAASAEEAIQTACRKAPTHDPARCVAKQVKVILTPELRHSPAADLR